MKLVRSFSSRIGKIAIASLMAISVLQIPVIASNNQNLALTGTATASSFEVAKTNAAQAIDGDLGTHWGTAQNLAVNEWLEVDFGKVQQVKQININFERSYAEQNILSYKVELFVEGGTYTEVYKTTEKAKQLEKIILPEIHQSSKVKVTILDADGGALSWLNVGISELEVYSEQQKEVNSAPNVNYMKTATVTTSSNETADLNGDKVKDGDLSRTGRWSSDYEKPTTNIWLKSEFANPTEIKFIKINLFERDVEPMPSNVESFSIKYTDQDGEEAYLVRDYENKTSGSGFSTEIELTLTEPVIATSIILCDFVANATSYNNVSISEIEVYSNDQTEKIDLATVVKQLENRTDLTADKSDAILELPALPKGFTVSINSVDFEQLVNKQGEIHHPLEDKVVQVSYCITDTATNETKLTKDIPYLMKGTLQQSVTANTKPVIIPEIAEWYSDSTDIISLQSLRTVTYDDHSLDSIIDEFISDYEDFTGIVLSKVFGKAQQNAFNFTKKAPDSFLGEEGYTMDLLSDRVNVASEAVTGVMYGMQTILQMYQQNNEGYAIGTMRDYPRFETRGFLLDVARKPISLEMIKDVSKTMRYYKMNDFQVHLSDNYIFLEQYGKGENEDEAFKAYEAFRLESGLTNETGESPTAKDYAISKNDFREFIQSERALGMKIVPEIDVPAHATSFTKIWPDLMVSGKVSPLNGQRPLIDHLDVSRPEVREKIEEIFDDYTKGDNPVFDSETTVHIGADEFLDNYTAYREFVNELVPHVKNTNTVRMWGGLTWIDDHKTEIVKEAIENVEINLWSSDWADGMQMYEMGYKLINTIDDYGYMVPNGSMGRANAYGDLLNISRIFNTFEANRVRTRSGYQYIPSGDGQILGAAFAIWSDNIDKSASGLTESDLYWRFFDAMPFYAEKTWATTGKEKGTAENLSAVAKQQGDAPGTNPYYLEDKIGNDYESYDFENGLEDTSENNRDLQLDNSSTAKIADGALKLVDNNSYVMTPIDRLGNDNQVSFDITLQSPAKPGDIILEADAAYGTHDLRIMEDGKLGFTRELYNYYFDYELPVGKTVTIKLVTKQQKTTLYVDDELVADATGKFIHNDMVKKENIAAATFALPLERIGSKTNAIHATIDNVVVSEATPAVDIYHKENWTGKTNSETVYNEVEGLLSYAFDNNSASKWHSNWQGATDKLDSVNPIWAEIDLGQRHTINQFSFTPRTDAVSGQVTKANLYVKANASDEWTKVAENEVFAANASKKTFMFNEQEVQFVRFEATESNDGWVAVSEFDVANKQPQTVTVYTEADTGGRTEGNTEVISGKEVTVKAIPDKNYVFTGWYKPNGEKVSDEAVYTFEVSANTALIARFVRESYSVTINGQEITVKEGAMIEKPAEPEKEGYTFVGWYVDNEAYDFTLPVTSDLVIEAKFEKMSFKVTLNGEETTVQYGDRVIKPADPEKEGHTFVGWYVGDEAYDFTQPVTSDLVIEARFQKNETPDRVNKTELQNVIAQAITDYYGFTQESVNAYKNTLAYAKMILADPEATQEEVNQACELLKKAVLVKENNIIPVPDNENNTQNQNQMDAQPNTGDTTNMSSIVILLVVSGAAICFFLVKRRISKN